MVLLPGPSPRKPALLLLLRHGGEVVDLAPGSVMGTPPAAAAAAAAVLQQRRRLRPASCSSSSRARCLLPLRALRGRPRRVLLQDGPQGARVLLGQRLRSSCCFCRRSSSASSAAAAAAAALCPAASSSAAAAAAKLPEPAPSVARLSNGGGEGRGAGCEERRAREGARSSRRRRKGSFFFFCSDDSDDRSDGPGLFLGRARGGLVSRSREGVRRRGGGCVNYRLSERWKKLEFVLFWVAERKARRLASAVVAAAVAVISSARRSPLSTLKKSLFLFSSCRARSCSLLLSFGEPSSTGVDTRSLFCAQKAGWDNKQLKKMRSTMLKPSLSTAAAAASSNKDSAASRCRAPAPASALRSAYKPSRRSRTGHRALKVRNLVAHLERGRRERARNAGVGGGGETLVGASRRGRAKQSNSPFLSSRHPFSLSVLSTLLPTTLGRRPRLSSPGHRQLGPVH